MTYRAGIGPRAAALLRMEPGEPRICCDAPLCVAVLPVATHAGGPPAWLLDHRKAPRWGFRKVTVGGIVKRVDVCPRCLEAGVTAESLPDPVGAAP